MDDRLNMPPTKSTLLELVRKVEFLHQGYQLLEHKRELLTRLVYENLKKYRRLRASAQQSLERAYQSLNITQMRMGSRHIRQLSLGMSPGLEASILPRHHMGVEYPAVTIDTLPLEPVGLFGTDATLEQTRLDFAEMAATMARLAEVETALLRLLEEQRKTQKRVNALKYNIIPRFERTIQYIRSSLEEEERNTLFQIKVLLARQP